MSRYARILDYRKAIDERCFFCDRPVEVLHHKDENHSNNSTRNLLSLCDEHHLQLKHDSDMQREAGMVPKSELTWARNLIRPDKQLDDPNYKIDATTKKLVLRDVWTGVNTFKKDNITITVDGSDRICKLIESFGYSRVSS